MQVGLKIVDTEIHDDSAKPGMELVLERAAEPKVPKDWASP